MSKRARITARQLRSALRRAGFAVIRGKGSHRRLRHPDGRITTVPVHVGEVIGAGLLLKILRDCELTPEQLADLI